MFTLYWSDFCAEAGYGKCAICQEHEPLPDLKLMDVDFPGNKQLVFGECRTCMEDA